MKIKVKLFARYRELTGREEIELEVEPGITVANFKNDVKKHFPQLGELSSSLAVAVNNKLADVNFKLSEGDEVALLPPMSGG